MFDNSDLELRKKAIRLRMVMHRDDLGSCIDEVHQTVSPALNVVRMLRSNGIALAGAASVAGTLVPFLISRIFKRRSSAAAGDAATEAPAPKALWKTLLIPALGFLAKQLLKRFC